MPSKTIIELSEIFSDAVLVLELTGLFLVRGNVLFFRGILRPSPNVELFTRQTKLSELMWATRGPFVFWSDSRDCLIQLVGSRRTIFDA